MFVVVVVVWFCPSSSLAFLISALLVKFNASFLTPLSFYFGGYLFVHTPVFFEKYLTFLCSSIYSSFGRQLCQNCGWAVSEPYVQSHITGPPCCSDPIIWGEELYTQTGFFVPWIFADRYTHRRSLWVVSLKRPSSVDYRIKKIFSKFIFSGSYRAPKFWDHSGAFVHFFGFFFFFPIKACVISLKRPLK